jgi:hypothetical protein
MRAGASGRCNNFSVRLTSFEIPERNILAGKCVKLHRKL